MSKCACPRQEASIYPALSRNYDSFFLSQVKLSLFTFRLLSNDSKDSRWSLKPKPKQRLFNIRLAEKLQVGMRIMIVCDAIYALAVLLW